MNVAELEKLFMSDEDIKREKIAKDMKVLEKTRLMNDYSEWFVQVQRYADELRRQQMQNYYSTTTNTITWFLK